MSVLNKGDKIAHYTIELRLGAGGMGEVYLAKDERLHRKHDGDMFTLSPERYAVSR